MEEEVRTQLPVDQPEPELPAPSFWGRLKANKGKVLGGILGVFIFAGAVFSAYKLGRRQVSPELVEGPTSVAVATPTPKPTITEVPQPSPSPVKIEKIPYKSVASWQTYTDSRGGFSVQYPQSFKLGGTEEINGVYFIYFWSCIERAEGEEPLCMSGYNIQVHSDYDRGSRRVWLQKKYPSMGNLYIEEVEIQGIKSLIMMDGNIGGSTGSLVGIPRGSKMYVFGFPSGWNPDTKEKPSLDFIKQVLSTFRFLD